MARVLMILMFVFNLFLASAGVMICVHAATSQALVEGAFLPYMITGWVCLGVGLIISLGIVQGAALREQKRSAQALDDTASEPKSASSGPKAVSLARTGSE